MDNQNKILVAVKNFIIGGDTSNIELLNATLHEDYTNVQNGFFGETGVYVINKTQYPTLIEEKTFGGIPREIEIESIDVEGNIAMVKAKLKSEQLTFKSFISLVQLENKDWQVIGNFPHIIPNQ